MKTNILFVCQICEKHLSSKRTVRLHISNLHKADPDNPLMYHSILASPKEVSKLLKKLPDNNNGGGEMINPDGEKVTNLEPGSSNTVMESELEKNLDNGEESVSVDSQPGCDELLPPNKNYENISKKIKKI